MFVDFSGKQIHVEVYGEGEPLVLLNGIMMSTPSWKPFIPALSKSNKLIILDLLDQGQSTKMTEGYPVTMQADALKCVLVELGIEKAHISGISYGAAVAMNFAVKYPDFVDRLVLFNCIAYTSPWLADVGEGWKAARVSPEAYYHMTIPTIYSPGFYNKNTDWINSRGEFLRTYVFNNDVFLDAMERLTDSMYAHDVREKLGEIKAKTLVVGSREDSLTPLKEQQYISEHIPGASLVVVEDCGHGTMYEKPDCFVTLLTGFVNHTEVEIV